MPVHYALLDNRLTPDPNDRYAQVRPARTVGLDELADQIAASGSDITRSSVTKTDVTTVLGALDQAITALVAGGASVNLPFANFSAKIQGPFEGDGDAFDASRHTVVPQVSAGAGLRRAFRAGLPVEKVTATRAVPAPLHYVDHNSAETDGALTPGGMGELTGARLAVQPDADGQGVVFVAEADGAETPVTVLAQNAPSKLLFQVPTGLAAGDYRVEVRAAFGDEVRMGRLGAVLTVA